MFLLFWPVGCAAWRWLSAGRSLNWQDTSKLRAQGLFPCHILTETGMPHSLLHLSPIGRNTLLFCSPVNSSSTRSQSSMEWTIPWMRIIPVLCLRWKSWERKDLSARWQVLPSTPPGSFLFKFNFLPRKWSLWQFLYFHIYYRRLASF